MTDRYVAWPNACLHPNTCVRHQQCMYSVCCHSGKDILVEIAEALADKAGSTE